MFATPQWRVGQTPGVDDVVIRRSTAEDFDGWFDLFQDVADEARWIGREGPLDRDERRQAFERTLDNDESQTFIAGRDGTVVGALGVTLNDGLAELGMVVPARGAGARHRDGVDDFVHRLVPRRTGTQSGAHGLAHNEGGIALYRTFGLAVEGRLARHHRRRSGELWDMLSMGLVLDTTSPGSTCVDAPSASRTP